MGNLFFFFSSYSFSFLEPNGENKTFFFSGAGEMVVLQSTTGYVGVRQCMRLRDQCGGAFGSLVEFGLVFP
jgi:hypothetical protein